MARRGTTPDERIYRLTLQIKDLKAEKRMLRSEHKAEIAQLKSQYRAGIKRLLKRRGQRA